MRLILVIACALTLSGCNYVVSQDPLFSTPDARGAPRLRPGVWMKPDKDCAFDQAKPARTWPECARPMLVRPDRLEDPNHKDKTVFYLVAANDPPIFQIPMSDDRKKPVYLYGGMRIAKRDAQGRVTGFVSWMAQCGPPPPKPRPDDAHPRYLTEHPLPGLRIDEESGLCIASEPGPVRASVKVSEAWNDDVKPASWVRDGNE
jgi:hypothetical protein